jgi:hypothetical protein
MTFKFRIIAAIAAMALAVPAFAQDDSNDDNWYFSWGYSRQQYADSDIHVRQPSEGNDFTVHNAHARDYPATLGETIQSIFNLNWTIPQENVRVGRFWDAKRDFAIELSYDHSKYNVNHGQRAHVTGTVNNQPAEDMKITSDNFNWNLHNGLNHIMLNAVWFKHLNDKVQTPGDLQLVSRVGAGILLPHADNTVFGHNDQVGPKDKNRCCGKGDWWQLNGWTVGVEEGFRYTFYKSVYAELTGKIAYGELHGIPVYHGLAEQNIWMAEEVLSVGFLF